MAQMANKLADVLIDREEYDQAAQFLDRAGGLLEPAGQPLLLSETYAHRAELALRQGQLEQAQDLAARSVALSEASSSAQTAAGSLDARAKANEVRVCVRALRVAGLVEERRGRPDAADVLFERAIALIEATEYRQTAGELELTYAELLTERGAHAQAGLHYRAAMRQRVRPARS